MPLIPPVEIEQILTRLDQASTTDEKGRALEDFVSVLFTTIPGIRAAQRNVQNVFRTEEIDIAFWNQRVSDGLHFLPAIFLVECKNWSKPVGSEEVAYFSEKLRNRGCKYGFLIAANGVTGNPEDLTRSHSIISRALYDKVRIMVITHLSHVTNTISGNIILRNIS